MDVGLKIRDTVEGEEQAVSALVMRVFDELVRADCTEEGVAEFMRAARAFVVEHQPGHQVTVAERGGRLLGMIDVRDTSHVSLLFVNSSPWAATVYERLGFTATAPLSDLHGVRFVPMVMKL